MKKLMLATLAFIASTSGAFAGETPNVVHASLELAKNGVRVSQITLSMLEGRSSPYSDITTRTYSASCKADSSGAMVSKKSSLTTGMSYDVTPLQVNENGTLLAVAFSYSELDGMKTYQTKGCTTEVPTTHNFGSSVTINVKPGQAVELPSTNGIDKFMLTVRTL